MRHLQLKSKTVRRQTLLCKTGALCRVFFPQGLIKSSRSSIAQTLRRRIGKGKVQLTSTTWPQRIGSGVQAKRRNPREGQTATANSSRSGCRIKRQSSEDFQESSPESLARHTVGKARGRRVRETSLASSSCPACGEIAYTDWELSCASAWQSGLTGSRQTGSNAEEQSPPPRLLSVAHDDARSFLPELSGALRGLPQGPRDGTLQHRSFKERQPYFHSPPRSDQH